MLILRTKLFAPTIHDNVIERPRLLNYLQKKRYPVLLVSAPAGSGKSTLISQWLYSVNEDFCWYSLDSEDNSVHRFFTYFVEALRTLIPTIGAEALALQDKTPAQFSESALITLINEILFYQQNITLVIDDYHLIESEENQRMMTFLVKNIPFNFRIIILSRITPPFTAARLKSREVLHELKQSELAFTEEEVENYCNDKLGLSLSHDLIQKIHKETEGWVTALHLCTIFMEHSDDKSHFIGEFGGDSHYIFDYLMEEVLENLPEDIRDFLVATSIFDRFSVQLCNALFENGDSEVMIRKLEEQNLFIIPLDKKRGWYRYHHLLNPLLQTHFSEVRKKEITGKAALWFYQNELWNESYQYACLAEDYQFAIDCFEKFGGNVWEYEKETHYFHLLSKLPDSFLKSNAMARVHYVKELHLMRKYDLVPAVFEEINFLLDKMDDSVEKRKVEARLFTVEARFLLATDKYEKAVEKGRAALVKLEDDAYFWRMSIFLALSWSLFFQGSGDAEAAQNIFRESRRVALAIGDASMLIDSYHQEIIGERVIGNLEKSKILIDEVYDYLKSVGLEKSSIAVEIMVAEAEYYVMKGDFRKSIEIAERALFYIKDNHNTPLLFHSVQLCLGGLLARTAHVDRASELIQNNRKLHEKLQLPIWLLNLNRMTWGYIALKKRDNLAMHQWLEETQIEKEETINAANESLFAVYGWYLFEKQEYEKAQNIFEEMGRIASDSGRTLILIANEVNLALLFFRQNKMDLLERPLINSLNLSAETGITGFMYEKPAYTVPMLQHVLFNKLDQHKDAYFHRSFILKLIKNLKEFVTDKELFSTLPNLQDISLSTREVDLLEHIARGETNQMIADSMFISVNTVKTHLKNINIKLEVSSRTHAVTKAQELGLIA